MVHSLKRTTRHAFSLVELSIVLVILGLLVGGVLSGQSLIRASELRSVTEEYARYSTAIGAFRDKYFALPGDMANAASFGWKDGAGVTVGNGSGDGQINETAAVGTNEISLFWVELAAAGLIEGSYTAVAGITMTPTTNVPLAKISAASWNVIGLGTVLPSGVASYTNATAPAASTFYAQNYGNAFLFGSGTNAQLPGGIMKSEEAWNIDTKMDDGKPDTGTVTTLESQGNATAGSGCGNLATSTSALAPSAYDLTNTSASACSLVFKTGY